MSNWEDYEPSGRDYGCMAGAWFCWTVLSLLLTAAFAVTGTGIWFAPLGCALMGVGFCLWCLRAWKKLG